MVSQQDTSDTENQSSENLPAFFETHQHHRVVRLKMGLNGQAH